MKDCSKGGIYCIINPEKSGIDAAFSSTDSVFVPKSKRTKSALPKIRLLTSFYNKMCELVSQLGDLVDIQSLTDTSILQVYLHVKFLLTFFYGLNIV